MDGVPAWVWVWVYMVWLDDILVWSYVSVGLLTTLSPRSCMGAIMPSGALSMRHFTKRNLQECALVCNIDLD